MSLAAAAVAMSSRALAPIATEMTLHASDGMKIAAQLWRSANSSETTRRRILALHGWMDNAATYHYLAPRVIEELPDVELVAIDFIGHGKSDHKSMDGQSAILAEGAYYVAEAVEQLKWTDRPFTLMGHSMGAAIGCLYTASFPEQISSLVLLEGVGPLARNPRDVAKHVRAHVQRRMLGNTSTKKPRFYKSLTDAVETRCNTAKNFPGNQYLSREASEKLVTRGSRIFEDGQVQFTHDPRLTYPSLQYFTIEQTEALYHDIQCPTCLLLAKDGWPFDEDRRDEMVKILQPQVMKTLEGSHHFHADPDDAEPVAREVIDFLKEHN